MIKLRKLLTICLMLLLVSCKPSSSTSKSNKIDSLWEVTVNRLLEDDLWTDDYKYDSSHVLMLPMQYAFSNHSSENRAKQVQFHNFFQRNFGSIDEVVETSILHNTQYIYFMTRYLNHSNTSQYWTNEHEEALNFITNYVIYLWLEHPAWAWGHPSFSGMKERLIWKLNNQTPELSYYRAIVDDQLFLFGISAELIKLYNSRGIQPDVTLSDIIKHAELTFKQEIEYLEKGKWLLQRGVWTDHPNHQYAGHLELVYDLDISPDPNTTRDSSHGHRYPLILTSLRDAANLDSHEYLYYSSLIKGLTLLFEENILNTHLTNLGVPTMNNYMDGHNGIFVYRPEQYGDKLGYGPNELSGTLTLSWYSFLNSNLLKQQMRETKFPIKDNALELLIGIPTTRNQHFLLHWPEYFQNGFMELYFLLSEEFSEQE